MIPIMLKTSMAKRSDGSGMAATCPARGRSASEFGVGVQLRGGHDGSLSELCPMPATLAELRDAMPAGGMFAGREWLSSPEPFPLSPALWAELEKLGHRLHVFLR